MNKYFTLKETVFEVTTRYPELIDLFADHGFENLRNNLLRKTLGKSISVETALKSKGFDLQLFEQKMVDYIELKKTETAPASTAREEAQEVSPEAVKLAGVLPCPIRLQFLEHLDGWLKQQGTPISYDLQAASMGLDRIQEEIEASTDESNLADVYLSAGYNLFFDRKLMGRYKERGVFTDLTGVNQLNAHFDNNKIDLKDPLHQYSIIGVVPAIFMVNTELLGDRPFPESWADLMHPEFENTMALPVRDLDLFNAVLLGIYKKYGADGVAKLGRGLMASMHPAEMVKTGGRKQQEPTPIITVMPYFFTWMAKTDGPMQAVWPKDGAIISPIFLLSKANSREKTQPLIDFLSSKEVGQVLAADGKFPSTHPEVDNQLDAEKTFLWPGWDFINNHDIGALLKETEDIFYNRKGDDNV